VPSIATTTATNPVIYPPTTHLDNWTSYYPQNMYCLVTGTAANTYEFYQSTNSGVTWTLWSSIVRANIVEVGPIHINNWGWIWWVYRTNEGNQDRIYVRRCYPPWGTTFEAEILTGSPANGGVAGAVHTGLDIQTALYSNGETFVAIVAGTTLGGVQGVTVYGMYSDITGALSYTNNVVPGVRQWLPVTGTGRITPSADMEHTGDAKSAGTPNLWIAFGRAQLHMVKMVWHGGGWTGPSSAIQLNSAIGSDDAIAARWDGERFLVAIPNPTTGATDTVIVYERNRPNTTTLTRTSPVHPQGVVRNCTINYNSVSRDFRVYAIGTATNVLYYVDYVRATGVWSAWATVSADAITTPATGNYGTRRGTTGDAKHDTYYARSTAPQVQLVQQALTYTPTAPTWSFVGLPYVNSGAADVAATLTLDWDFHDPDPNDTQGWVAISRQIGAGALAYFRASDSTWQVAEVQNATATTSRTLAVAWGADSDADHTYRVKTWDAAGAASPYSDALVIKPSAKVNPTITTPADAGTVTTDTVVVTWSVAQQTAYQVQTITSGLVLQDSGKVNGTATSYVSPERLANTLSYSVKLWTWNNEGLQSDPDTNSFTVTYTEPAVPALTVSPQPGLGVLRVKITNPTPGGGQPAVAYNEVWRLRTGGVGNGIRIATNVANNGSIDDWKVPHGVDFSYRALVRAVTGASVYSAWTS
jgi:hypothetical protein